MRGRYWQEDWLLKNKGGKGKNPYEGEICQVMGSGSLEGEGKKASQRQNLGSACAFMTEAEKFISWTNAEGAVNKSIAMELQERAKWFRVTINPEKSFLLMFPHFCAGGGLHVKDIASIYTGDDAVGLKGRLWFWYSRPSFKRAHEIEAANALINPTGDLAETLAEDFKMVAFAHNPDIAGPGAFKKFKDTVFSFFRRLVHQLAQRRPIGLCGICNM